jgi:hypothetical protein
MNRSSINPELTSKYLSTKQLDIIAKALSAVAMNDKAFNRGEFTNEQRQAHNGQVLAQARSQVRR